MRSDKCDNVVHCSELWWREGAVQASNTRWEVPVLSSIICGVSFLSVSVHESPRTKVNCWLSKIQKKSLSYPVLWYNSNPFLPLQMREDLAVWLRSCMSKHHKKFLFCPILTSQMSGGGTVWLRSCMSIVQASFFGCSFTSFSITHERTPDRITTYSYFILFMFYYFFPLDGFGGCLGPGTWWSSHWARRR